MLSSGPVRAKSIPKGILPQCLTCRQSFSSAKELTRHFLGPSVAHNCVKSTDPPPHEREPCEKQDIRGLFPPSEGHSVVFGGDAGLPCKFCGKMFDQSCELVRHMTTHTGNKLCKCRFCPTFFLDVTKMKNHVVQWHKDDVIQEGERQGLEPTDVLEEGDQQLPSDQSTKTVNAAVEINKGAGNGETLTSTRSGTAGAQAVSSPRGKVECSASKVTAVPTMSSTSTANQIMAWLPPDTSTNTLANLDQSLVQVWIKMFFAICQKGVRTDSHNTSTVTNPTTLQKVVTADSSHAQCRVTQQGEVLGQSSVRVEQVGVPHQRQACVTQGQGTVTQKGRNPVSQGQDAFAQQRRTSVTQGQGTVTQGTVTRRISVSQQLGAVTQQRQGSVTEGQGSVTQQRETSVIQGQGPATQQRQGSVTEGQGSVTQQRQGSVTQGQGSVTQQRHDAVTQQRQASVVRGQGPATQQIQGSVTEGQGSVTQQRQGSVTQGQGSVTQQRQDVVTQQRQTSVIRGQGLITQQRQGAVTQRQGVITQQRQGAVTQGQGVIAQQRRGAVTQGQGPATQQRQGAVKQQRQASVTQGQGAVTQKAHNSVPQRQGAITHQSQASVTQGQGIATQSKRIVSQQGQASVTHGHGNVTQHKQSSFTQSQCSVAQILGPNQTRHVVAQGQCTATRQLQVTSVAQVKQSACIAQPENTATGREPMHPRQVHPTLIHQTQNTTSETSALSHHSLEQQEEQRSKIVVESVQTKSTAYRGKLLSPTEGQSFIGHIPILEAAWPRKGVPAKSADVITQSAVPICTALTHPSINIVSHACASVAPVASDVSKNVALTGTVERLQRHVAKKPSIPATRAQHVMVTKSCTTAHLPVMSSCTSTTSSSHALPVTGVAHLSTSAGLNTQDIFVNQKTPSEAAQYLPAQHRMPQVALRAPLHPLRPELLDGKHDVMQSLITFRSEASHVRSTSHQDPGRCFCGAPCYITTAPTLPWPLNQQHNQVLSLKGPVYLSGGPQQLPTPVSLPTGTQNQGPVYLSGGPQQLTTPVSLPTGTQNQGPVYLSGGPQQVPTPVSLPTGTQTERPMHRLSGTQERPTPRPLSTDKRAQGPVYLSGGPQQLLTPMSLPIGTQTLGPVVHPSDQLSTSGPLKIETQIRGRMHRPNEPQQQPASLPTGTQTQEAMRRPYGPQKRPASGLLPTGTQTKGAMPLPNGAQQQPTSALLTTGRQPQESLGRPSGSPGTQAGELMSLQGKLQNRPASVHLPPGIHPVGTPKQPLIVCHSSGSRVRAPVCVPVRLHQAPLMCPPKAPQTQGSIICHANGPQTHDGSLISGEQPKTQDPKRSLVGPQAGTLVCRFPLPRTGTPVIRTSYCWPAESRYLDSVAVACRRSSGELAFAVAGSKLVKSACIKRQSAHKLPDTSVQVVTLSAQTDSKITSGKRPAIGNAGNCPKKVRFAF